MKTLKHLIWNMVMVIITISSIACKKETENGSPTNTDTVNWGYVKEYYTEKPIPNAKVVVYGVNPKWAVQYTLYTDNNGRYEFPIVEYLPELEVSASEYLISGMQAYAPGDFYDQQKRTIHLYQPAETILHVKNVKSQDDYTHIRLNDFYPHVYVFGKNADTLVCCIVSRRYETARLQTVVRRIKNAEYVDSIAIYSYIPTKANGNIANIYY